MDNRALTYYVMHSIDFDSECLIANRPTFEGAVIALLAEHARAPDADLSVWRSDGTMLVPDVKTAKDLIPIPSAFRRQAG